MIRKPSLFFVLLIASATLACGSVISKDIRKERDKSLTFLQVSQNPNAYKGDTVIWGGEIIKTDTQEDGSTLIEVFERSLGSRDAPDIESKSEGRFLIKSNKFLDPYVYKAGRKITIGGVVTGEEIRQIGNMNYHYPVILSKQIHLWNESYYYPSHYYYDPWWGYPSFGMGFGFSYYSPVYRVHKQGYH